MNKEISWIYIAGLVDAKSYIGIQKIGERSWVPLVRLQGYDTSVLSTIQKVAEGGYMNRGVLVLSHLNGLRFLEKVYPYLKDKKRHAEIIFELRQLIDSTKIKGARKLHSSVIPEENQKVRDALYMEMKALNARK